MRKLYTLHKMSYRLYTGIPKSVDQALVLLKGAQFHAALMPMAARVPKLCFMAVVGLFLKSTEFVVEGRASPALLPSRYGLA